MNKVLHVAVGVIRNDAGQILIAKRPDHLHQGGLWEFPGGKVESEETVVESLRRELDEELAIQVHAAERLIQIRHQYPDREVLLDVWNVHSFSGQARGCEGQEIKWVAGGDLMHYRFPAANKPIISAALLPAYYAILEGDSEKMVLDRLETMLAKGVRLIQIRLKTFPGDIPPALINSILNRCEKKQVEVMLNSALLNSCAIYRDGIHLCSADLLRFTSRPPGCRWLAASCHTLEELRQAESVGVDFAVLAPVLPTQSHPDAVPLGWERFSRLTGQTHLPVYALGGLRLSDLESVRQAGGQGVAGISCFF